MSEPSPSSSPDDPPSEAEDPTPSPMPGCIILITVSVIFAFLVTLFTVVFQKQSDYWAKASQEQPAEVPQMQPTEAQIQAANAKLEAIQTAALADKRATISLSAEDLNALIASKELLADFRGQTFVKGITEDGIEAEMCQPIRTGFLRQGIRYIHGDFWMKPEKTGKTVLFRVADIKLPGIEIPEGLVSSYPAFMKLDPKMKPFDEILPKIGIVYLEGDQMIVKVRSLGE